jgi:hypothetical protein
MEDVPTPDDANPKAQLATDVRERVNELQARANDYTAIAKRMPGGDEQENRRLVSEEFALLSQIIPMLSGPEMTGEVQQQLRIIESTRSQLANGSVELAAEPTVGTGMRAAHRALSAINQQAFSEVGEVGKSIDAMTADVNQLDLVSGAQHRWVAAQAFVHSADAINKMVSTMQQRLGNQIKSPAVTPAPPPAKSAEKGPTAS